MIAVLIIAAVIVGIGLIRIGADITYRDGALSVLARVAGFPVVIYPRPKKKKTKKTKEKKSEESGKAKKEKKKLSLAVIRLYLHMAADILRVLKKRVPPLWRSFVISKLYVYLTVASSDAAHTAEQYGKICAAVSAAYPVYREVLNIKHHDVTIDVDFCRDKLDVDASVRFHITLGALVIFLITLAFGALVAYYRMKKAKDLLDPPENHKRTETINEKEQDKAVQVNE